MRLAELAVVPAGTGAMAAGAAGAAGPAAVVAAGAFVFVSSAGFPFDTDASPFRPMSSIATSATTITPAAATPTRQNRNKPRNRIEPFIAYPRSISIIHRGALRAIVLLTGHAERTEAWNKVFRAFID